ncbi:3-deoxy-D-manno-octulosonic acid kinase [Shewanella putrefaciens]|jgi:3-deoxy-D-manno-octulosonic acid kinase|uniref:3-deoxy-D-manno-octulosonic acid kinase n=1 Tax=Shewanella putrefaciens (strain CN-32 / ATCC BAA-453) TaxID=319224 RepID=A4YCC1_SHEPC|nr:3-deoxy-D-manno-octulosonic acid kinase [Shewanella putrefaciens]MDR6965681.1 3-deoxy-D-manno-octulosonic acid kinase [Shewanella putrefaciens]QGS48065.1 3-deoxy-D-manno-octulosonic acid kinase [Shewanella putrefaciens]UXK08724.1 3-deoxy-D-manno-octulosonic acid kinase [Shewanella putrefaciens]
MNRQIQIIKTTQGHMAICQDTPTNITPAWFSVDFWRAKDAIVGSSKGRYTTWFVTFEHNHWVLRHYWRGGLMEKFSKDAYVYTGLENTRAMGELRLLDILYREDFTVPKPIAINIVRDGLFYRADIIIERVEGAEDLVAKLGKGTMSTTQWQMLGATIAQFHQRGVYHADLNAKNILFQPMQTEGQQERFYLIDFDRGELKTPNPQWQKSNLDRLLRSFNKEQSKQPNLAFTADNWTTLMQGYQAVMQSPSTP